MGSQYRQQGSALRGSYEDAAALRPGIGRCSAAGQPGSRQETQGEDDASQAGGREDKDGGRVSQQVSGRHGKVPRQKTSEEEAKVLNKLYEEYADIGRPISRSMKHKLLLSNSSGAGGERNSCAEVAVDGSLDLRSERVGESEGAGDCSDVGVKKRRLSGSAGGRR